MKFAYRSWYGGKRYHFVSGFVEVDYDCLCTLSENFVPETIPLIF